MDIVRLEDAAAVAAEAVLRVEALLRTNPTPRIGFPTGKTPIVFFQALAARRAAGLRSEGIRPFMLDEYRGVAPSHPSSFAAFLRTHVVGPLGIAPAQVLSLDGAAADADAECARYERALQADGGMDMAILGLGGNGHVAFNEPGSGPTSRTRVLDLTAASIAAARADFPGEPVPTQALSTGVATLLDAREIVLLVTGESKAGILAAALTGPATADVPASLLRDHPRFVVLADRGAAGKL